MWSLVDDRDGSVIATGTEAEVKKAYFDTGRLLEWDLYAEDAEGNQFTWNPHMGAWDEL